MLNDNLMSVNLPNTKNPTRNGVPETVLLKDPYLIKLIGVKQGKGEDYIFSGSELDFRSMYREAMHVSETGHERPTPHGLRRGGATWHFSKLGSYDKTMEHGRWSQLRTAKLYIDGASSALALHKLSPKGKARLEKAQKLFRPLLERHFKG